MARKKEYVEEEVAEKAMQLFWGRGYAGTSMRDLEKHLGINQFSIYASFKSKQGLLRESISVYERRISEELLMDLEDSSGDFKDIKTFFYKFVDFVQNSENIGKGCFMVNTIQELDTEDQIVKNGILRFTEGIKKRFSEVLVKGQTNGFINRELDAGQGANYLLGVLQGLSTASKQFSKKELDDFIGLSMEILSRH